MPASNQSKRTGELTEAEKKARKELSERMKARHEHARNQPGTKFSRTALVHKTDDGQGWTITVLTIEKLKIIERETLDWRASRARAIEKAEELLWELTKNE